MKVALAQFIIMVGAGMLVGGVCLAFHTDAGAGLAGLGAFLLAGGILGLRELRDEADRDRKE